MDPRKVKLLKKLVHGVSVQMLCGEYGIDSSTGYNIKKQRDKILKFQLHLVFV